MIDLHCHILPNVDDGSKSIEETIAILKRAEKAGFNTICFTPHYAEPQYLNSKQQNEKILEQVKEKIKVYDIQIDVLLGNEVFIRPNIENLLQNQQITTLANTQYVLIEVPMFQELPQEIIKSMLDTVKQKGFKVVIAHPERYISIQKNPSKILEYFGEDVIFQGNYASILGAYGKDAQKTIKKLLKDKMIHYFSSDIHHLDRCFYEVFDKIKSKLLKVIDEDYFEILSEINPRLIIENKEVINVKKDIEE